MERKSEINLSNLERELRIIELNESIDNSTKFGFILTNASDNLKDFILKNKITNLESLNKKIHSLEENEKVINEIIDVCTKQRGSSQNPVDYVDEITENLKALGASEKSIIKVLSYNIWPKGPSELKDTLILSSDLREFRNTVQDNIAKLKSKKTSKTQKAI